MKRAQSSGGISSICTTRRMWSARTVDIPTAALFDQHVEAAETGNRAAPHCRGRQQGPTRPGAARWSDPCRARPVETKNAVVGRVAQRHPHAGADKGAGEGLADAAGGAGDERDAARRGQGRTWVTCLMVSLFAAGTSGEATVRGAPAAGCLLRGDARPVVCTSGGVALVFRLPVPIDVWKARDPISEGSGTDHARHRHPGRQYR